MKRLFWIVFLAMAAVYAAMAVWSLPTIAADAGGLMPFDLRPMGYSFEEATEFLTALSPEGRAFYAGVQHRLDLAYPALLAATLVLAALLLTPSFWLRGLVVAASLAGMVFDYCENGAVARMLAAGPEALTAAQAEAASRWTLLKSLFATVAMTAVLALGAMHVVRRWRGLFG